ncbi:MAG: response regulator transcription factor [Acidimicrobiia bacterium]|nr:response regulator transcription factor [Acidimicrobiia bacterium]
MTRPRVVLVDDHDIVRAGAATYLETEFDIVGEAADVSEAIDVILDSEPDVVLIDVHLPSGSGAEVVKAVGKRGGSCRFLALSVSAARRDVVEMLDAGVSGYLLKSTLGEELPTLLNDMLDGERPVSPQVAGFMLDIDEGIEPSQDDGLARLTKREREVVELIARGYTYKAASEALFVSPKTIEAHMHNIFEKLGVASRHELSVRALRAGWVDDGEDEI